ncbi:MAG TPA: sigma factor, partial [Polyangiaceae bacterium]|nr:sigma factor [Polyangiaceae bacterium]
MLNQSTESELNSLLEAEQHNAAIGLALRCYGPEVFSYLIVLLRDKGLAEEAYSMFTEALVRGIRSFKQQCPFRAWAYIVAKNEALRVMRQRRSLLPLGST